MRLGLIDFLNSLPLNLPLERGSVPVPGGVTLVRGPPSFLNREVIEGRLDVSPVSSVFFARHADRFRLLPSLSINSEGFVDSVTLFSARSPSTLDGARVCVTRKSATSDVLLRIVLQERYGCTPRTVKGDARPAGVGAAYDACLLIGDEALACRAERPDLLATDLGEEWARLTGLPMVFAVWVARRDVTETSAREVAAVHGAILAARAWSGRHPDAVIDEAVRRSGLPRARMEAYFRGLSYDLGPRKIAGLRRFLEAAARIGELPAVPAIEEAMLEVPAW